MIELRYITDARVVDTIQTLIAPYRIRLFSLKSQNGRQFYKGSLMKTVIVPSWCQEIQSLFGDSTAEGSLRLIGFFLTLQKTPQQILFHQGKTVIVLSFIIRFIELYTHCGMSVTRMLVGAIENLERRQQKSFMTLQTLPSNSKHLYKDFDEDFGADDLGDSSFFFIFGIKCL